MPLGDFEKGLLRLLAANRNPESYIAGATVFLRREDSHRQSQDIDVFHDTVTSVPACKKSRPFSCGLCISRLKNSR